MRVRVTLSPAAERDLEEIGDYVAAEFGSNTAYNVIRRIRAKIDLLRDHPSLGMEDERIGNRRRLVARPYLIAYRIAKQSEVEVLRIVHGARDLGLIFPPDDPN